MPPGEYNRLDIQLLQLQLGLQLQLLGYWWLGGETFRTLDL